MQPLFAIPIVTDHRLYVAASVSMLSALRTMRPAIVYLAGSITDPIQREALGVIRHNMFELQAMLCQIADVEKERNAR